MESSLFQHKKVEGRLPALKQRDLPRAGATGFQRTMTVSRGGCAPSLPVRTPCGGASSGGTSGGACFRLARGPAGVQPFDAAPSQLVQREESRLRAEPRSKVANWTRHKRDPKTIPRASDKLQRSSR